MVILLFILSEHFEIRLIFLRSICKIFKQVNNNKCYGLLMYISYKYIKSIKFKINAVN